MKILLLSPFHTGSHRQWAEGFHQHSRHEVNILSLKGKYWKWRMFGGAVALAEQAKEHLPAADLVLATDMLDLATFAGLCREELADTPLAIYFHENQLTYPWSPDDPDKASGRANEYAFINYTSALAADKVLFNSQYHHDSFLGALPDFLRQFPDYRGLGNVELIRNKSEVLPLGMDLSRFDAPAPFDLREGAPILLWNHRWEYDKCPELFFRSLYQLKAEGLAFRLVVLGESYARTPPIFAEAREKLKAEILHFGYAPSAHDYAKWLKTADILPVTSQQDFFGGSVVEAMYAGALPLLPARLAYPEHVPPDYLYHSERELLDKLRHLLGGAGFPERGLFKKMVTRYDWRKLGGRYDGVLEKLI